MGGVDVVNGTEKKPTRKMVAKWLIHIYKNISEDIGRKEWRKKVSIGFKCCSF
jgi:hypothetical protein